MRNSSILAMMVLEPCMRNLFAALVLFVSSIILLVISVLKLLTFDFCACFLINVFVEFRVFDSLSACPCLANV